MKRIKLHRRIWWIWMGKRPWAGPGFGMELYFMGRGLTFFVYSGQRGFWIEKHKPDASIPVTPLMIAWDAYFIGGELAIEKTGCPFK